MKTYYSIQQSISTWQRVSIPKLLSILNWKLLFIEVKAFTNYIIIIQWKSTVVYTYQVSIAWKHQRCLLYRRKLRTPGGFCLDWNAASWRIWKLVEFQSSSDQRLHLQGESSSYKGDKVTRRIPVIWDKRKNHKERTLWHIRDL